MIDTNAILSTNHEDVVRLLYRAVLRREPDPNGLASFCRALDSGKSVLDLLRAFSASAEFKAKVCVPATPTSGPKLSFSQNGEDVMLWRCFQGQKTGVYVDVGASTPVLDSVTQLFYENGWWGLNYEPIPERAAELKRARPRDITVCAAVGNATGTAKLLRTSGIGGLSTIMEQSELGPMQRRDSWSVDVPQITLRDSLLEHGIEHIDFLKIDVE